MSEDRRKILVFRDEPDPIRKKQSNMEHIILLLRVSAAGFSLKPLAILPLLTVPIFSHEVNNFCDISGSESGWITGDILKYWLDNQFILQINALRSKLQRNEPVLVILDNRSSRDSIEVTRMWNDHKIVFFSIPPHTSHIIQPLDRCPNGEYKKMLEKNLVLNLDDVAQMKREKMLEASRIALHSALSMHFNLAGWRSSGLYPVNPEKILKSGLVQKTQPEIIPEEKKAKKSRGAKFNGQVFTMGDVQFFPGNIHEI